ncbi:alpha/beta hydrolase [Sporosarcina sp. P19]|uniref:alpha/beta fold hydrolase n=1 Tax=Sporosarcina sp. P19 TaxID=2048258 RepID=UPI000C16EA13|nr:alpha/beta hydrolase [Sporosarcina sp. P19]PIC77579.1 alpha/beta hydrolase [Sporosarcina sp. P19]
MSKVKLVDLSIHYLIEGSGPPLVLLHGLGNNSKSWIRQLEGLKKDYTVIAWDAPGYGQSADPIPELQHFSQFADHLKKFLDSLQLEEVYLLGHSMGSAIAIDFAIRFPEMVTKLIIAAPTRGAAGLHEEENIKKRQARHDLVVNSSPEELARQRTSALLAPNADPAILEYAQNIMAEVRPAGYKSVANSLYHLNQMDEYSKVSAPTLVICGEEDRVTPICESEIIVDRLKEGRLKTIADAGHLSYLEKPKVFNKYVLDFLEWRKR